MFSSRRSTRRGGVTLLELLVVLAAIAILAAVVGPSLLSNLGDAKQVAARSQIDAYGVALGALRIDIDRYPTTSEGLDLLRNAPTNRGLAQRWRGPYTEKLIAPDPWGRPYVYRSPGEANRHSFDLYSLGRDGQVGGTGEDADITSWGGEVKP